MKKITFSFLFLLISTLTFAQAPTEIDPAFISTLNPVPTGGIRSGEVKALIVQSNGKILVSGGFNQYNSLVPNASSIMRLNSDGSKDPDFNVPVSYLFNIHAMAVQSNGKIIIGGEFTNYSSSVLINRIARLNSDGTLDTSFSVGTGFNNTVKTIVIQPDGKIIIGGDFTTYKGVAANRLIRLNTDGSVDTSFAIGTASNNTINKICLQPDGKILLGGAFTLFNGSTANKLTRLDSNGAVDTTFNIGSGFPTNAETYINSIALQTDGKLVVVGAFATFNGSSSNNIVRLNVNGSLDASLNCGTGFNFAIQAPFYIPVLFDAVIQNDGKIIVGGTFDQYNGISVIKGVVRIQPDGNLDTTFDTTFTENISNVATNSIALQNNGKIIIGGDFPEFDKFPIFSIARLENNGLIDPTFGSSAGFTGNVSDTFEQPDGKILVCGEFGSYNKANTKRVARINSNGTLDTSFNTGIGFNLNVSTIVAQPDGKILVGGNFSKYKTNSCRRIARLNSDGTIDSSFNIGLGFNIEFPNNFGGVNDFALQADGKIIVVGYLTSFNGTTTHHIVRLNNDGTIDATFNPGSGFNVNPQAVKIQPDGKILVSGSFDTFNGSPAKGIVRLNTNGSIDTTFSTAFLNAMVTGPSVHIYKMGLQSDGKIVVIGGFTSVNGNAVRDIVRLNADGSYDSTFSTGSFTLTSADSSPLEDIDIQSDGKILLVGHFYMFNGITCNGMIRLNTDGTKDSTFSTSSTIEENEAKSIEELSDGKIIVGGWFRTFNGKTVNRILKLNSNGTHDLLFNATGLNNNVNTVALQADHKIVVGGTFTLYSGTSINRIARLNTDGTIDNNFVTGTGFNNSVNKIKIQQDTKMIVGGIFSNYNGTTFNRIIRLSSDGTPDTSFNIGTGFNNVVNTIAIQSDGKIIIGGNFTSYNGSPSNRIIRLNSDGSMDTSFAIGSGFDTYITDIAIQQDGKIIIGGNFTSYNGIPASRMVRLNTDGSIDTSFSSGTGFNTSVNTIAIQPDGKIVVGGSFTMYNSVTANRIVRLNTDGSQDTTFVIGTGFNDYVSTLTIAPDGKIVAGGNFIAYKGTGAVKLARINTDGTLDSTFNTNSGFDNTVDTIAIQQDGEVLVGGNFNKYKNIQSNFFLRLIGDQTSLSSPSPVLAESNTFVLYPNPVDDVLKVVVSDNTNNSFKMYNLLGAEVKSGILNQNEINVSNLRSGVYILEIKNEQGKMTKKFIKK